MAEIHEVGDRPERRLASCNLVGASRANLQCQAIARHGDTCMAAVQIDQGDRYRRLQSRVCNWPKALGRQRQQCAGVARVMGVRPNRGPRALGDERRFDRVDRVGRLDSDRLARHHEQRPAFNHRPVVKIAAEHPPMRAPSSDFQFLKQRSERGQLCVLPLRRRWMTPSEQCRCD